MQFYIGMTPSDAPHFDHAFISANTLSHRRKPVEAKGKWIMDSGAFTLIAKHGCFPDPPAAYAALVRRQRTPGLQACVAQDYMCAAVALEKTGLTVSDHQRMTVERYEELLQELAGDIPLIPVLQGRTPDEFCAHLDVYGKKLIEGAWVGVGSIVKLNSNPSYVLNILSAILKERPDLRLHGLGVKTTTLAVPFAHSMLHTADSMAWNFRMRNYAMDHSRYGKVELTIEVRHKFMREYIRKIEASAKAAGSGAWATSGLWGNR